jgi:acid phosphatase (class A)
MTGNHLMSLFTSQFTSLSILQSRAVVAACTLWISGVAIGASSGALPATTTAPPPPVNAALVQSATATLSKLATSPQAVTPAVAPLSQLPQLPLPVYFAPAALQLAQVLPPYPAIDSTADKVDKLVVRALQISRTSIDNDEAEKLATLNARVYLAHLLPKIGATFDEVKYARTIQLLDQLQSDMRGANRAANDQFPFRTRPAGRANDIEPSLAAGRFVTSSYPSANASTLYVWAGVLLQLVPENQTQTRAEITRTTERAAWLRVVSGMHFPSDLIGSRAVSRAALSVLAASETYRAAIKLAQPEFAEVVK